MLALVGVVGAMLLTPLVRRSGSLSPDPARATERDAARRKADALLDDLEFDHATGKLADDDYAALRARLQAADVPAAMTPPAGRQRRGAPGPRIPTADDTGMAALEAEIRAARRPRRFCTQCGTALPTAARFCPACGQPVAGRS
jgi:hypothetical protein